jgi:hypothetical protein
MALNAQQQQDYADFLRRFEADPTSISGEEAARRYHELIGLASPEEAAAAQKQALGQLPHESRRTLAQHFQEAHNDPSNPFDGYTFDDADQAAEPQSLGRMTFQAGQQDQSTLSRILNSPLGRMAMAAIAAYLARRMFGGQQSDDTGMERQAGGGLDIGAILGALAQAQAQGGAQGGGQAGQGGLDIGAILGALAQAQGGGQAGGRQGGGTPDLGDLLGALGGAQGGGQAGSGQSGQGGLDIGAILGALAQAQGGGQAGSGQSGQGGLDIGDLLGALGGAQGGGQPGEQAPGRASTPVSGQPDLSDLLSGTGNAQGANSELGRILTSLGGAQQANIVPPKDQDEQEDKQS